MRKETLLLLKEVGQIHEKEFLEVFREFWEEEDETRDETQVTLVYRTK